MLDAQASGIGDRETIVNMHIENIPAGRVATADEVANATLFWADFGPFEQTITPLVIPAESTVNEPRVNCQTVERASQAKPG